MKKEKTIDEALEEISEIEHEDSFNDLAKLRTLRENMSLFIWELREKSTKKLVYYDPYKIAMDRINDAYKTVSEALDEEYMRNASPK